VAASGDLGLEVFLPGSWRRRRAFLQVEMRSITSSEQPPCQCQGWLQRTRQPITTLVFVARIVPSWLGWSAPARRGGGSEALGRHRDRPGRVRDRAVGGEGAIGA
jgi:hypothetical protein